MKVLFFLMNLVPAVAGAQELIMIDRNFQKPFEPCDSITLTNLSRGGFPMYMAEIPAVVNRLEEYTKHIALGKELPEGSDTLHLKHCMLFLSRNTANYFCVLQTRNDKYSVPLVLASGTGRKETVMRLSRFIDYLRNNRSVALQPNHKEQQ